MSGIEIEGLAARQRKSLHQHDREDVDRRLDMLREFRSAVQTRQPEILAALKSDLGKCEFEAYGSEIGPLLGELDHLIGSLRRWSRPHRVATPLLIPGASYVKPEPYGAVLVIAPWNYPLQLALIPAMGAIAAGNHVVVKPSEHAPGTAAVIAGLLGDCFEPDVACAVLGGIPETQELLAQRWDYIFYTGSTAVGRIVMTAAAENLTPVTLEMGGKNPCIVTDKADLKAAAKRIAWGKCFNAGQTCVAPDFVLAHRSIRAELVTELAAAIERFYGPDPSASEHYGRIVNRAHLDRLTAMLEGEHVVAGGTWDAESLYLAPTIVDGVAWTSPLMRDEIFGPVLPVLDYDDLIDELERLSHRPKPLTLYLFSRSGAERRLAETFSAGAVVTNDTLIQFTNPGLPFGGVGDSGIGAYHGRHTFETFSHHKALLRRRGFPRLLGVRWPPYRLPMWLIRLSLRWFG